MKILDRRAIGVRRCAGAITTVLAAAALWAWPPAPATADVIDHFDQGRKFLTWGNVAEPTCELADHQLKISQTRSDAWTSLVYYREYELAEGHPVEFRLDVVSANGDDVWVGLMAQFVGELLPKNADRGYALYVLHNRVVLQKQWQDDVTVLFDVNIARRKEPRTLFLTLTRQGDNIRIGATVALRDGPQTVLFSKTVVDRPGAELGPLAGLIINTGSISGSKPVVVVDRLECCNQPEPAALGIQRSGAAEATVGWSGCNVMLRADSVDGPWRPCPEPHALGTGGYCSTLPLAGSACYFRVAQGFYVVDHFDSVGYLSYAPWRTASVVPGSLLRPTWGLNTAKSYGRILGTGQRNQNFTLRWSPGIWYRDCVATVDILSWGKAMDDASFGLMLRAKPEGAMWFTTAGGMPTERYTGTLTFKTADIRVGLMDTRERAESVLTIAGPAGAVIKEQRFPALNQDKPYRLRFWAVGDQLTLELFERVDLATPIRVLSATDRRVAEGMDGMYGTKSFGGTYDLAIDRYTLSGTLAQ